MALDLDLVLDAVTHEQSGMGGGLDDATGPSRWGGRQNLQGFGPDGDNHRFPGCHGAPTRTLSLDHTLGGPVDRDAQFPRRVAVSNDSPEQDRLADEVAHELAGRLLVHLSR